MKKHTWPSPGDETWEEEVVAVAAEQMRKRRLLNIIKGSVFLSVCQQPSSRRCRPCALVKGLCID